MQSVSKYITWLAIFAGALWPITGMAAPGECSAPPCGKVDNTTSTSTFPARDIKVSNHWCYSDRLPQDDDIFVRACLPPPLGENTNKKAKLIDLSPGHASNERADFRSAEAFRAEGGCTTEFKRQYAKPWVPARIEKIDRHGLGSQWINISNDQKITVSSIDCSTPPPPSSNPPPEPTSAPDAKYWVDTFASADGYPSPTISGYSPVGQLYAGRNYVFCKTLGTVVSVGSDHNHWWLWTDLDSHSSGNSKAYVSAYYLTRWGNDVAKDNNGTDIPDCVGLPPPPPPPPPSPMPTTKYWVDTFAPGNGYLTPNPYSQGAASVGQLFAGTNYVFCKKLGDTVTVGNDHNHWWLWTDLDSYSAGHPSAYVSAYYLTRWGNDEAKDNNGTVIPDCP